MLMFPISTFPWKWNGWKRFNILFFNWKTISKNHVSTTLEMLITICNYLPFPISTHSPLRGGTSLEMSPRGDGGWR